jgi:hypothetical protein
LVVSILSVFIGPMFYTFRILAESFHYPFIAWLFYLILLSVTRDKDWRIDTALGIMFGLACLNKISSLAIVVSYVLSILIIDKEKCANKGMKWLPITIFHAFWRHKYAFVACAVTIAPYLLYRSTQIENTSALPYDYLWRTFIGNIGEFDVLKYAKWWLVYFGQLNLSTGLFLLPLSLMMAIRLLKRGQGEERAFGYLSVIVTVCVLSLAVLQSGYNLGRLTERHFFVLTPLIFILAFLWLTRPKQRFPWIWWGGLNITVLFATYAALFFESGIAWPACDSAFYDSLQFLKAQGASQKMQSVIILCLSAFFMLVGVAIPSKWVKRVMVCWIFVFLTSITIPTYSLSDAHLGRLKSQRWPLVKWLGHHIQSPANIVLMNLPRDIATDYTLWNRDYMSNMLWQGRKQLEIPSKLNFMDVSNIEQVLNKKYPTYIISPVLRFSGVNLVESSFGFDLYKKNDSEEMCLRGSFLDFGESHTRQFLTEGWRGNEGPYSGGWPTFVWAIGSEAEIEIYVGSVTSDKLMSFRIKSFFQDQSIRIAINGKELSTIDVQPEWNEYEIAVAAKYVKVGKNRISFKFRHPKTPSNTTDSDIKKLAVAFDWLKFEDYGS